MTDPTTRPVDAGAGGVPHAAPSGAVADARALRHTLRAEQERLSADAEVDRRARAARLELDLRERRREADRHERRAKAQEKQDQIERRRARRDARRARLRIAAPRWADRGLFVLPILFPMAVAWAGQIQFAMTVMHWPLAAAIVFAAGFELSTAYVARLDWLSRAAGDSALLFRGFTWVFASGAAIMNYWHAAGPGLTPTGEAVSYGLMSIIGVVLWELWSIYRHRTALRAEGKLPAARPRFGLARWIWFPGLTYLAWLIVVRDGQPTTDLAWRSAIAAIERYRSPRSARKAVRSGRAVPHPASSQVSGRAVTRDHQTEVVNDLGESVDQAGRCLDGRESSRGHDSGDTLQQSSFPGPVDADTGATARPAGHYRRSTAAVPARLASAGQSGGVEHRAWEADVHAVDHEPHIAGPEHALRHANRVALNGALFGAEYAIGGAERFRLSRSNGRTHQPDGGSSGEQPATPQTCGHGPTAGDAAVSRDPRTLTSIDAKVNGTDAVPTDRQQSGRVRATVAAIERDAERVSEHGRPTADRADDHPLDGRNRRYRGRLEAIDQEDRERDTSPVDTTDRGSAEQEPAEPKRSEHGTPLDGERRNGTLRTRMAAYARARIAEGVSLTGAELDREFGTSDYGRKVLRQLAAATNGAH